MRLVKASFGFMKRVIVGGRGGEAAITSQASRLEIQDSRAGLRRVLRA